MKLLTPHVGDPQTPGPLQVQLTVTDHAGVPAFGLSMDSFQLKVNGKPVSGLLSHYALGRYLLVANAAPKQAEPGTFDVSVAIASQGSVILEKSIPKAVEYSRKKMDILFIIDCSGSMKKNDPRNLRVKALHYFLDLCSRSAFIDRIGILGFSAGGETAALTSLFQTKQYEDIDEIDQVSHRPDFTILIYPGGIVNKENTALRDYIKVTSDAPPMFFAQAFDDGVRIENSLLLAKALKDVEVPAEVHVFAKGGHGFGLRLTEDPCTRWPMHCHAWMESLGILK